MSPEFQTLLITTVLLSQIVVLSIVAPIRLRRFYSKLYVRYPEAEYPQFYPVPCAEMERSFRRYLMIRMATGPIGLEFLWTRLAISLLAQALFLVVPSLAFRAMRSLDFSGYRVA